MILLQLILEAIPKDETDQARRYRGYIAVDDLYFDSGDSCQGHCTFDSGMCGFLNDNSRDDFDWTVVSFILKYRKRVSITQKQKNKRFTEEDLKQKRRKGENVFQLEYIYEISQIYSMVDKNPVFKQDKE